MLEILFANTFVVFGEKAFPIDCRHSNGHKFSPFPSRNISVLIQSRIHTVFALCWKETVSISVQLHICIYNVDDVRELSINIQDFDNYLGKVYPTDLEIRGTTVINNSATYLDLLLSIGRDGQLRTSLYDKRDGVNFHFWVAIFHLRRPRSFLSHSSYGIQRLPPEVIATSI